jgi:hypothetical protein
MWFASTQPPYGASMPKSGRRPQHHFRPIQRGFAMPGYPPILLQKLAILIVGSRCGLLKRTLIILPLDAGGRLINGSGIRH